MEHTISNSHRITAILTDLLSFLLEISKTWIWSSLSRTWNVYYSLVEGRLRHHLGSLTRTKMAALEKPIMNDARMKYKKDNRDTYCIFGFYQIIFEFLVGGLQKLDLFIFAANLKSLLLVSWGFSKLRWCLFKVFS